LFVCEDGGVGTDESCNVCHAARCTLQIADFSLSDKRLGQKKSMLQSCCSVLQWVAGSGQRAAGNRREKITARFPYATDSCDR
jgi:hypothetical protein